MRRLLSGSPGRVLRMLPALAWAALIFHLSSQSVLPLPPLVFEGADKLIHAGTYAALTGWLILADPAAWRSGRRWWWWILLAALYGVSDELHQHYVPGRDADFFDFLADAGGALAWGAIWLRWRTRGSAQRCFFKTPIAS